MIQLPSIRAGLTRGLAAFGAVALLLGIVGVALDIRAIDETRGGYAPPYTGYTGEPFDWSRADRSAHGLVVRGRVVNLLADCTSGMMHFEVYGVTIPWRPFSPRARVVHRPAEACRTQGFDPRFD
jgi:hypothetical protein